MTKVTTESGFVAEVDESVFDDMLLLEAIRDCDTDVMKIPVVIEKIIPGRKDDLYNHIKDDRGRVTTKAVTREIIGIINALKDGKK